MDDLVYTFNEDTVKSDRLTICTECEHNDNNVCAVVGTNISELTLYQEYYCPENKWNE
jgi:hypothetical protein